MVGWQACRSYADLECKKAAAHLLLALHACHAYACMLLAVLTALRGNSWLGPQLLSSAAIALCSCELNHTLCWLLAHCSASGNAL